MTRRKFVSQWRSRAEGRGRRSPNGLLYLSTLWLKGGGGIFRYSLALTRSIVAILLPDLRWLVPARLLGLSGLCWSVFNYSLGTERVQMGEAVANSAVAVQLFIF